MIFIKLLIMDKKCFPDGFVRPQSSFISVFFPISVTTIANRNNMREKGFAVAHSFRAYSPSYQEDLVEHLPPCSESLWWWAFMWWPARKLKSQGRTKGYISFEAHP